MHALDLILAQTSSFALLSDLRFWWNEQSSTLLNEHYSPSEFQHMFLTSCLPFGEYHAFFSQLKCLFFMVIWPDYNAPRFRKKLRTTLSLQFIYRPISLKLNPSSWNVIIFILSVLFTAFPRAMLLFMFKKLKHIQKLYFLLTEVTFNANNNKCGYNYAPPKNTLFMITVLTVCLK